MKFQIPKAHDLSRILASRNFQINMLAKIQRFENDKMLLKNEEAGKEFNQHFGHITDSLDLYEFPYETVCEGLADVDSTVCKSRNHPSIVKIKERYKLKGSFSFRRRDKGNN